MTAGYKFRPKKKVGQIYINIPGSYSLSMEAFGMPDSLNAALQAASDAFWIEYKRIETEDSAAGKRQSGTERNPGVANSPQPATPSPTIQPPVSRSTE